MFTDESTATAQRMLIPGEREVPAAVTIEPELSLGELTEVWTLGAGSDGFDDFAFKCSNWLSGLPGDAERCLEESASMGQPILWAMLAAREEVEARGVATALRALVGGKSLSCIRHHPEK